MNKLIKKIDRKGMQVFFDKFESFSHKFFRDAACESDANLKEVLVKLFYSRSQRGHELREINEIFQTMNKVYHYGSNENSAEMNLLENATDKFLIQYVDIDGIHELFRPSFFNFEWMMHLEYVQQRHDYSYYRDHYLHQIRNLYEMFILLQEKEMWRDCMKIYQQRSNTVANRMAESVAEQKKALSAECIDALSRSFGDVDEWCYHYIIFSTAIVSALVHDIGYPITYMKRNLSTLQDFLPQSHLFMGLDDGIPQIKSLLGNSLLFETVDNGEIIRRLNADDHGVYSAIILLCQYYDNGRIFGLEPVKRMVIELSALVIYNHTLRYHFQDEKNYDRYQNVFTDNPISYLFRLCDDMQEWERVYFEITGKGTFFICDKCKMPMIRHKDKTHDNEAKERKYEYVCTCGTKGINTVLFPYRRLMNVAPFKEAVLTEYKGTGNWVLELKCDKGALLQLARYNPNFAVQRAKGIRELRGLVCGQSKFPNILVKAFVTNNPIAIKAEILREFLQNDGTLKGGIEKTVKMYYNEEDITKRCLSTIRKIKKELYQSKIEIYDYFKEKCGDEWNVDQAEQKSVEEMLKDSIRFYLFILFFCEIISKIEFESKDEANIDNGSVKKKREKYELAINSKFTKYAETIARVWKIADPEAIVLIADCIVCMYGNISEDDFFEKRSTFRHNLRTPLRADMTEILKKYTREPEDDKPPEYTYDYYSDYYFFYMMDCLNQSEK